MKKIGFLFFLWMILLLVACGEIEFKPITVAGSYEAFVDLMNIKAHELGMDDTHFVTATFCKKKRKRNSKMFDILSRKWYYI